MKWLLSPDVQKRIETLVSEGELNRIYEVPIVDGRFRDDILLQSSPNREFLPQCYLPQKT